MYKKDKELRFSFRLSKSMLDCIAQLAFERDMTYGEVIRYILNDYFLRFDIKGVNHD